MRKITDETAAARLRDRVAREIAECLDQDSPALAEPLLPVYRWLNAIANAPEE